MAYLVINLALGIWLLIDASNRKVDGLSLIGYIVGTMLLSPVVVPIYFAIRPLKRGETREGGAGWNILKNFALLWTCLMIIWAGWMFFASAGIVGQAEDEYEAAGAVLGMGIGFGVLGCLWFVPMAGALVLGLFLKRSTVEEGPTGALAEEYPG